MASKAVAPANHDLPVYVVEPVGEEPPAAVALFFSDVYGWKSGRATQLCTRLAATYRWLVLDPDFFRGDCWTPERDRAGMPAWIATFTWANQLGPDVDALLTYAATKVPPGTPVVAAGFCHGGYLACRAGGLTSGPLTPLVAVASGHPSVANLAVRLGEVEELILKAVQCPLMLLTAGNDSPSSKPGGLADTVLGARATLVEEADKVHGWIVRGDDEAAALHSFDTIAAFLADKVAAHKAASSPGGSL